MKNFRIVLLACALSTVIAFGITAYGTSQIQGKAEQTVYDRVMQKREIRCGYLNYPPLLTKDPNTGAFSGIGVDIMNRVADMLNVKLVWAQESSWAGYIEDLNTNRFDVLCNLDFFLPFDVGRVDMSDPLFYTSVGIYKRADDLRFSEGFRDFNNPDITISGIDGSLSLIIQQSDYPKAKTISGPQTMDYSLIMQNVVNKKADVVFVENSTANSFIKTNPGTLVNIAEKTPLRVFPYFIPFKLGEDKLRVTFNSVIAFMRENGEIEKILAKHESGTKDFFRLAKSYQ
jgi:ABC-type amino acid transport substrate-binding protein